MRYGLYKWVVMLMGLTNAPAMFIQTMNNLFWNMLNYGMTVFLDNILVYSRMVDEHFTLFEKVLVCLHQHTFYCKLKKCSFLRNSTTYLGFEITPKCMHISDSKVRSLSKWPVPTTAK